MHKELRLWVYNYNFDKLREVVIIPNKSWGGEGSIGCGVGYGLLHRIPAPLKEGSSNAGSVLYNSDDASSKITPEISDFITPAPTAPAPSSPVKTYIDPLRSSSKPPVSHRHDRHRPSSNTKDRAAVAELMREGEENSRENDVVKLKHETIATEQNQATLPKLEQKNEMPGQARESIFTSQDYLDDFEEQLL